MRVHCHACSFNMTTAEGVAALSVARTGAVAAKLIECSARMEAVDCRCQSVLWFAVHENRLRSARVSDRRADAGADTCAVARADACTDARADAGANAGARRAGRYRHRQRGARPRRHEQRLGLWIGVGIGSALGALALLLIVAATRSMRRATARSAARCSGTRRTPRISRNIAQQNYADAMDVRKSEIVYGTPPALSEVDNRGYQNSQM